MMKRILAIGLLVFLIGYAVWFAIQPKDPKVGLESGNKAPDFELSTLDGEKVKLSELKGKKVLINFWATWCPPCRAEMPEMQKIHKKYKDEVVVLAVNFTSSEKNKEVVKTFANKLDLTFPIVYDEEGVNSTYDIFSYPTTYLVDEEGFIQKKYTGAMSYETMEGLIK
ncbi:TlpA family protein disulfide reductase [Metabacillus arenae]|uniref:Redoxin domain-containing protein n=1 Tax=Metabacillus arenae TaxID=2771434 RepID=A0A926NG18_9BACI|nr:redoxin domain-containing protein [Metabacillus arenae]MBD1379343.1 redoxin domain-containing protein [Metabacillus arenae]